MKFTVLRSAALALVGLFGVASVSAQTGYTTVTGAQLHDATGTLLTNATIRFQPVNSQGVPVSFRAGGAGGQTIAYPVSATVTAGAFSIVLADTTLTSPANPCYSVSLISNLTGRAIPFPGYSCIQPSGSTWSFDAYIPSSIALPLQLSGCSLAVGTVTSLSTGASPTITNSGSSCGAILNFGIPLAPGGSGSYDAVGAAAAALSSAESYSANASNLAIGTVPPARLPAATTSAQGAVILPTGTASSTTVWCGNGTWCTPPGGGATSFSELTGTATPGQLPVATSSTYGAVMLPTGTASSTTVWCGDGTWCTPAGGSSFNGGAVTTAITAPGFVASGTNNGAATYTYSGTSASAPGANSVQWTQNVAVPTPYVLSNPAYPPIASNSVLNFYGTQGVFQAGGQCSSAAGLWLLNEQSGSTLTDQSCRINYMTTTNTTWGTLSGLGDGVLTFNGTTSYTTSNSGTPFNYAYTQPFSVWAWVEPTTSGQYSRFMSTEGGTSHTSGWVLGIQGGIPFFEIAGTGGYPSDSFTITSSGTMASGSLNLIVVTYDGTNTLAGTDVYFNGALQTSKSSLSATLSTSSAGGNPLSLGYIETTAPGTGTNYFTGSLGPVGVISRVLTTAEVANLYANPYLKIQ